MQYSSPVGSPSSLSRTLLLKTLVALAAFLASALAQPPEPLVGTWQLESQKINDQPRDSERLTLRVTPEGNKFTFAFSVPVNKIDFVSMSYTARLDGSQADVKNARGETIGTIQISTLKPSHYKLLLTGSNRPQSSGQLTVSPDGKTLTSESSMTQAGHSAHLVQVFSRQ